MNQDRLNEIVISLNEPDHEASKKLNLSASETEIRQRWRLSVTEYLNEPSLTDAELIKFIAEGCGGFTQRITRQQAYRDLSVIKSIVSKVTNASKEWWRYTVTEMAKEAYSVAKKANDAKGMAMAADKIGKYQRVDQIDDNGINFDEMIPPNFEFTSDVTLLNIKQVPDLEARRRELRKHFGIKTYMQATSEEVDTVNE